MSEFYLELGLIESQPTNNDVQSDNFQDEEQIASEIINSIISPDHKELYRL